MEHIAQIDNTEYTFRWNDNQTLLEALLAADIPANYSCQQGQCGACQCSLEGGKSHMKENHVLSDYDIRDGEVLACQTYRDEEGPYQAIYWF
ncbi:2Fe-2S iron-sulfur cluster-binding protein [Corynebacterium freiburgense]|uniref:2Fe-2S iron-sulfur cluster-binding protein n=1 Tax=Corynebacterium freiburgense TaxID=556548 RepID=UPI00040CB211|nr:2Fe-2S iron-sulfur cluster binding domain-containing protein [Corynebacterium freiburgense]WJZ03637.1 3-ketosteroid-9-alpha-hydroxylase reductase subunit [Corynebacterium freiburgense]